jgi:hypothetical protein
MVASLNPGASSPATPKAKKRIELCSVQFIGGTRGAQVVDLDVQFLGEPRHMQARGVCPIEAVVNALGQLIAKDYPEELRLQRKAVIPDRTGLGMRAAVALTYGGKMSYQGQASDPNLLVASARACVEAVDRLLSKSAW